MVDLETMDLSAEAAQQYIKKTPELQIVDVRSAGEFKEGHLADAVLIPLNTLPARAFDLDREKPVLLYCASGGRSASALGFLLAQGFNAKHIEGGINEWESLGLPLAD
jgi:rhodanese-related sulfurtransferase